LEAQKQNVKGKLKIQIVCFLLFWKSHCTLSSWYYVGMKLIWNVMCQLSQHELKIFGENTDDFALTCLLHTLGLQRLQTPCIEV